MTLGLALLYVGCVLFMNGVGILTKIEGKAFSVMNFFTGGLLVVINAINIAYAVFTGQDAAAFFAIATNMLFGFTYLFVGITNLFKLDGRPLGWYCLFVAVNTIPCAYLSFAGGDPIFGGIWLVWGVLWLVYWIAGVPKPDLSSKFVGWLTTIIGVATCWLPGFMMIANWWY
ncbi:MAG: AmiS/UreI family transporter [Raoultibacter sp.]